MLLNSLVKYRFPKESAFPLKMYLYLFILSLEYKHKNTECFIVF